VISEICDKQTNTAAECYSAMQYNLI